jgi:penicillin-binding protein 2
VAGVVKKVAGILGVAPHILLEKAENAGTRNFTFIKLADNIGRYQAMRLSEQAPFLPGIIVRVEPVRVYEWGSSAAHLAGYIQPVSLADLGRMPGLLPGDYVGKTGIEKQYDAHLRGTNGGLLVEVTAGGVQRRVIDELKPRDGESVVLTIDKTVQNALARAMEGYSGVAIAVDPNNGEILGFVSAPSYNPNSFVSGIEDWEASYLFKSMRKPLLNRALQCQYPPGSIFKMITAFAGLESGAVTPNTQVNCEGFIELGKYHQKFRCWERGGHKIVRLVDAIARSCDVYFYELGLKLGQMNLNEWAKKFMLGEKTGIDLPFEATGLVPDRAWKKNRLGANWYDGDTVNMSIGQGYVWVTPIQVAQYISAVANGGYVFQLHLLKRRITGQGDVVSESAVKIKTHIDIKKENIALVKRGMLNAVTYGTGNNAYIPGLAVAGKTGTAQNPHGKDHAWFVCFAPCDRPKIALVVLIENGGGGGGVAAPVARNMLLDIFGLRPAVKPAQQ